MIPTRVHVGYAPSSRNRANSLDSYMRWISTLECAVSSVHAQDPWIPDYVMANVNAQLGRLEPVYEGAGISHSQTHGV